MAYRILQKSCIQCGQFFEFETTGYTTTRQHCYRCKPPRVTARSTRRGCPTCGRIFNIDTKNPQLKQCPKCRKLRAEKVEQNRQKK